MSACWHVSQRATWPPSTAVRQRSIADIALSWPRLRWPAWARRQAGPWARKISAISTAGRAKSAAASGGWQRTLAQMLQWAFDRPQRGAGDVAVVGGGIQLLVAQQHLDHPDVHLLLQEVGRKAMPQRMQTDAFADA